MHAVGLSLELQQAFRLDTSIYIKILREACFGTLRKSRLSHRVTAAMKFKQIAGDPRLTFRILYLSPDACEYAAKHSEYTALDTGLVQLAKRKYQFSGISN